MKNQITIILLLALALFLSVSAAASCEYKFPDGKTMDLSKLGTLTGTFVGKPVYLNLCQNVDPSLCPDGTDSICSPKSHAQAKDISFASREQPFVPPTLGYNAATKSYTIEENSGKAQCFSFKLYPRSLNISLKCGKKSQTFQIVDLEKECKFETSITVPCNFSDDGLSGGAIFLIVFFSVLCGYFVVGFLICKFGLKKEGIVQSIPQYQFWFALPGLYVAGLKFTLAKIQGCIGGKKSIDSDSASSYGATEDNSSL